MRKNSKRYNHNLTQLGLTIKQIKCNLYQFQETAKWDLHFQHFWCTVLKKCCFFCWNFYSLKNECFVLESGLYICWHLVAFLLMRKTQNTMSMNFFYIPCFNVAASGEEIRQTSNILQISTLQNICIMVYLFVKLIFKGIIFRRSEMCRNVIKTDYSILVLQAWKWWNTSGFLWSFLVSLAQHWYV